MTNAKFTYDQLCFLQPLPTAMIAAIARGDIDVQQLARQELAGRGVDQDGTWVGFELARRVNLGTAT